MIKIRPISPIPLDPVSSAIRTLSTEAKGLQDVATCFASGALGKTFDQAAHLIVELTGRVVVTGMGKSGHIGRKVAATLASTGTPSLYIHPGEASHGDLGMIGRDDAVLAISWSGETTELGDILTYCRRFGVPLIALTSRADSTLAQQADVALVLPRVQEACPNRLAPTSSTVAQLAVGDALAVALIELRGFSPEDFKVFHPGGKLGAQLCTVAELMATDDALPQVDRGATILQAIMEMSRKRYGITAVIDGDGLLIGAFTDGDLRRTVAEAQLDAEVERYMTEQPAFVAPQMLASEALAVMNDRSISQIFVCEGRRLVGVLHLHDVLRVGVV